MLEFAHLHKLLGLFQGLRSLEHALDLKSTDTDDPDLIELLVMHARGIAGVGAELDIPWLVGRVRRLEDKHRNQKLSYEVARHEATEIAAALREELSSKLFFVVEGRDGRFYTERPLTSEAAAKFPSADEELLEAGKCFATSRYTATVLHAMRALEEPLNRMRRTVGLKAQEQSWGPTLDEIEAAIRKSARPKTKRAQGRRRSLLEAAVEFRGFKDAWRNHAMHARQNYSREQAERILGHVKSFIEQLSPLVAPRPR